MDILLFNARLKNITEHACLSLPLGLAYIGSVLKNAGYIVSAIDLNATPLTNDQIRELISKTHPKIIGISVYTPTFNNGISLAAIAKEVNPQIKVIMGGPHASILYGDIAAEKNIDVVVRGEGEHAMLELAESIIRKKMEINGIPGIAFKEDGVIKVTENRSPVINPDDIPWPHRSMFNLDSYIIPIAVLASRGGCPYSCYFCAVNNIWDGTRRYRKPQKVIQEIQDVVKTHRAQAERVTFSDDTFSLNRKKVMKLCELMQGLNANRLSRGCPQLSWRCTTRVDLIDEGMLKTMYYSGCCQIQYGIEAGSQKILDSIGKRITMDQIRRTVDLTLRSGIEAACSFMFPHPEDDYDTISEQIRFMKELATMGASQVLAITTPLPGTYLYNYSKQLGVKILSDDWDDYDCWHLVISTKNLSWSELNDLHKHMVREVGLIGSR